MKETIKVNFHCHSVFSDGEQSPENLAASLAAASVRYAALTDHDSIDGLSAFQEVFKRRGGSTINGVELTTWFKGREIHLLGYGFDAHNLQLEATLISIRQITGTDVHSIAGALRKKGTNNHAGATGGENTFSVSPDGRLEIEKAIALIHQAGGIVFLAHPFQYESDPDRLNTMVVSLIEIGLDGLEAFYEPYSAEQQAILLKIAQNHKMLVCAGTDLHGVNNLNSSRMGIEFPREHWVDFRRAVFGNVVIETAKEVKGEVKSGSDSHPANTSNKAHRFHRRSYTWRLLLPTLIAIILFLSAIWGIILPSFEQSLIDRKRDMIRELTNSAWSILVSYEEDVQDGLVTRPEAQELAAARIESLRYGPEGKDYFWIQDLEPRMIMHPFRPELNGQDLNTFTDPNGVEIFVKFADLVRQNGEGYVDYVWQWKDDPTRLEPKQSYIRGFEPWGWIIGTGIYTDDVLEEVARLEKSIINTALIVSGVVVLLLLFVLQLSLRIEHQRQETLDDLQESTGRYHALVEATTEGTLLIVNQRCRYANPTFLKMTGYTSNQLDYLDIQDLLPRAPQNEAVWAWLEANQSDPSQKTGTFDGILQHVNGDRLECLIILNPVNVSGQPGLILLARDVTRQEEFLDNEGIYHAAHTAPVGIFRAQATRKATLLEMNPAARAWFENQQPALADLFSDPAEFDEVMKKLQHGEEIHGLNLQIATSEAIPRHLSLSARIVHDESAQKDFIDGVILDITRERRMAAEREALIEKLQTSLLFLHEPVSGLGRNVLSCNMLTSISQASKLMTAHNVSAALVTSENDVVIGIVTDHDLRARVLSTNLPLDTAVHNVMSAPLTKISSDSLVYEALMYMEETGVRHLAVEDHESRIISIIDNKELIQFQRYGPIILSREISRATSQEEIASLMERTPALVKALLDSSARPRHVTNMLASICDSVTSRLIDLAIDELGPPPGEFAFIGMGSQGRQELTLVTDQDNGIIFSVPEGAGTDVTRDYFLALGNRVCEGLSRAGYLPCRGGVMANNPRWCRSIDEWIMDFKEWVRKAEPQEIINLSIFLDFRTVYGQHNLAHELRRSIHATLKEKPSFFPFFAQNALSFRPPFRLLGSIYLGGSTTEPGGEINLKDAMMPLVSFARLYALHHQINQTHTIHRIEGLGDKEIIPASSCDEMVAAYDFLMQLRLKTQITLIQSGQTPTNYVHPGKLGDIQKESLKQAFAQIAAVQKKISYDYLGGT